ncbi:hypothetical protein PENTCL1PPCAC_9665, partial [Pristionchus entomophagus]
TPGGAVMKRDRIGSNGSTGSGDLHIDRLLPDFSFLRICLDHITLAHDSPYLNGLQHKGAIFGYILKYSFPCPDGVSSSLRAKVILRASSFSSNAIFFRHKRVNLVKLHADVIPFWTTATLTLDLEVQLSVQGKYSTRPLARCSVPLEDLLLPPFAISRDYDFLGAHFAGSALVKIDLGSKQRTLMARLERWRGETEGGRAADATFTVPPARHTRSRSGSRCRSHSSDGGQENNNHQQAEGTASEEDDDVFYDAPQPARRGVSPFRDRNASLPSLNARSRGREGETGGEGVVYARPVDATRRSSASSASRDRASPPHALRIRLAVHAASGLPMARDERGLLVAPSVLISVRGRDGELRSPVQPPSRSPRFEWSCTFDVSSERRNVVVKVLHQDQAGNDVPLGFVSLLLPTATVYRADYELTELGGAGGGLGDASMITLSVESRASPRPPSRLDEGLFSAPVPVAPAPQFGEVYYGGGGGARTNSRLSAASSMTLPGAAAGSAPSRRRSPSPDVLILETREEIESRLRRNMSELDILMSRLDRK